MLRRADAIRPGKGRFALLLLVIAAVGVALLGWLVLSQPRGRVTRVPQALLPTTQGHVMGSDSAVVEIVEFGDFECPACGRFATTIEPEVRARLVRTGLARFRFVDFPLEGHPNTLFAHHAAACAGAQGRFWEMHDRLFASQRDWTGLHVASVPDAAVIMKGYASSLGLDTAQFDACLDARTFAPTIQENYERGVALHVPGTPTFIVGDAMLHQALPTVRVFEAIVDSVARQRQGSGTSGRTRPAPGD